MRNVQGTNTKFTSEVSAQGSVQIEGGSYIVEEVLSDTDLLLNLSKSKPAALPSSESNPPSYKALVL